MTWGRPARPPVTARLRLREPFNGLSHLCGAGLGIAALVLLVSVARGNLWHVSGFAVYGATLILLYLASALYHLLPLSERGVERLRTCDRIGIYLLIAGTYTPLCLVPLRGAWGWSLLSVVWGLALVGIAGEVAWRTAPEWVGIGLYVLMGWLAVVGVRAGAAQRAAQASGQRAQMAIALGQIRCAQIATCVDETREMRGELVRMVQGFRAPRRPA